MKNFKVFVAELRGLDEASKRKWFLGLTAASTLIVVFLWAVYLNATVASVGDDQRRSQLSNWDVFKAGLSVVADKAESGLANSYVFFHDKVREGKTFTISK